MADLEDFLKFSWAATGNLGIRLYEPYLNLFIDCSTPQSELLKIFPEFYNEILNPGKIFLFTKLGQSAFRSLRYGWQCPYGSTE